VDFVVQLVIQQIHNEEKGAPFSATTRPEYTKPFILEEPTHLQDSQFEKSGPKSTTLGEIVCDAYG